MNCYFIIACPHCAENSKEDQDLDEIYLLLKQLFRELRQPAHFRKQELVSSYLNILQIKTEGNAQVVLPDGVYNRDNFRLFQKFITLLEQEMHQSHKVMDYSDKLGITTRKLSEICRGCQGKSPKEIINEHLVREAKKLLTGTMHSIKQISLQMGFSDQYQFSKYFKNHEKVSPAGYRKNNT